MVYSLYTDTVYVNVLSPNFLKFSFWNKTLYLGYNNYWQVNKTFMKNKKHISGFIKKNNFCFVVFITEVN
jgi:hypothetical protein